MKEPCWLNGKFVAMANARISPLDRGFLFGEGLFETWRTYRGRPYAIDEHLRRMAGSARRIGIDFDPDEPWERFAREALPRLVYHLESVGAHPPSCKGMVVAAFVGDRLHFLRAGEVLRRAAELMGVAVEELVRRHGTGESRTAVSSPPLPLPPGGVKS